jgi:DNA-binding MurR/RpiR family transcriptional regulator
MSHDPTLFDQLTELLPTLTASERKVADTILVDPARAAQFSISDLARSAHTSTASVNRLCRRLDISGYRSLRLRIAQENGAQQAGDPDADPTVEVSVDLDTASTLAALAGAGTNALRRTAALINTSDLDRVARAIDRANRVQIAAQGGSTHIAAYLVAELAGIGVWATTDPDPTSTAAQTVTLRSDDVALALSHSGTAAPALDFLAIAHERGALTVAVTSSPNTPLARQADISLATTARTASLRYRGTAGRHAQLFVCDAIYVRLAQRRGDDADRLLDLADDVTRPYLAEDPHPYSTGTSSRK